MAQTTLIDLPKFDIKNFSITDYVAETDKNKAMLAKQKIAYPRYKTAASKDGFTPQFKTGEIIMTSGGMTPKVDKQTGKPIEEKDRLSIKIPLDLSQKPCGELFDVVTKIDEYVMSIKDVERTAGTVGLNLKNIVSTGNPREDTKKKIFPVEYAYTPIVRTPKQSEAYIKDFEEKNKRDFDPENDDKRPQFIKAKIPVDFTSGTIKTAVFVRDPITKKRTKVPISCVDDIAKYLTWKSTVRFVLSLPKLWLQKTTDNKGVKSFGLAVNIIQMQIDPAEHNQANNELKDTCAFSDDDDTEVLAENIKSITLEDDRIVNQEESPEQEVENSESDESDSEGSELEEESDASEDDEPVVTKGKGKIAPKKQTPPPKKVVTKKK